MIRTSVLLPAWCLAASLAASLAAADGVSGLVFDERGFAGPATTLPVGAVDATWAASPVTGTATPFSVIWQGTITPRFAESYTLVVKASGRFRLWLDGKPVLNGSSETAASATVSLGATGAPRAFRLEYSDWDGVGRCSLFWRSAREGTAEVPVPAAQLRPLDRPVAVLPTASAVSPVCIAFERPHDATVRATGAAAGAISAIDRCSGWADVPLAAGAPTTVSLALAGGPALTVPVAWTPTDVGAGGTRTIRRGDALLLSSPQAGMLRISGPDSAPFDVAVAAGQTVPQTFAAAGAWSVTAIDAAGTALGMLQVAVADIALPERLACQVNWQRTVRSPATPDGAIQVSLARPALGTLASATAVAGRCSYAIKPIAIGEQAIVFRLADGAILAARPVDGYTLAGNIYTGNYVFVRDDQGYGHGFFRMVMKPRLDYQTITIDFFVTTVRIDGLSKIVVPGTALDEEGGWSAPFVVSPNQWKSCHRLIVTQAMPDALPTAPTAIARMVDEIVGEAVAP